jgi:hypothetical protein
MHNDITVNARVTVAVAGWREDPESTAQTLIGEVLQPFVRSTSDWEGRFAIVTDYQLQASGDLWSDDSIQFPRLLAEICATQANLDDAALCESMELTENEIGALFGRAQAAWESIKATTAPARSADQVT